ncbi:MAG: hypothetical protein ACKVOK_03950 [Flavobacteriales bacterium]
MIRELLNAIFFIYFYQETENDYSSLITQNTLYVYAHAVNKNGFGVSDVQVTD